MHIISLRKVLSFMLLMLLAPSLAYAHDCDPRSNELKFDYTNTNGYSITNFNFRATDKVIGDNQDKCDHEVLPKTYNISTNQSINFIEGRSNSSGPATYFKEVAPKANNTFNSEPSNLNFVFHGDMYITVSGGGITTPVPYVIHGITIGQGHAGSANNWWFGGLNCNYISGNMVTCTGTQLQGGTSNIAIDFQRGGGDNSVNDIYIKGIRMS
jgi:hypothetical protein